MLIGVVVLAIAGSSAVGAVESECTNSGEPGVTCIFEPTDESIGLSDSSADGAMTAPSTDDAHSQQCRADVDCTEIIDDMPDLQNFAKGYEWYYANMYQYCDNKHG